VGRRVDAFGWDDQNAEHIARHGISDVEVEQLLSNRHLIVPNKGHEPRMFLVGQTNGGRLLTVVIEPTRDEGTWRPVTAWEADDQEQRRFKGATR